MNINNVKLQITAVYKEQYPSDQRSEIAFVGRSNVGKSSLINLLLNRKSLAWVSSTPGKTRVINFYDIDGSLYFVDLPGYGYAKVSEKERMAWADMINDYLFNREQLKYFILLVDIRHKPNELDVLMIKWIKQRGIDCAVVATKSDKIKPSEMEKSIKIIRDTLNLNQSDKIIPVSSLKRTGREELWALIEEKANSNSPPNPLS